MLVLMLPLLAAAVLACIGIAAFVFLPVKFGIVAAVLCIMAIGTVMAMSDGPFH